MTENRSEAMSQATLERALNEAYPVLFHRLNSRYHDPQLAEEVSWDCLTQAFELWQVDPGYFIRHDLTAWSSRRANWRAVDRLRDRGRFTPLPEEQPLEDDRPAAVFSAATQTDPEDERLVVDRVRTWEALQALDERDRYLLTEHFYESTSDQALGAELFGDEASPQALGLRVWRLRQKALVRLQKQLLEAGIDPEDWGGQAV
jgi:DNA-directed RNA polymerase specialized sigma24 family protein